MTMPAGWREVSRKLSRSNSAAVREKALLLILDNFEHLLDGVELVADILHVAPEVQIIATSRERLHLHEEQVYPIQGLEFPDWETPENAGQYTAVKLFLQAYFIFVLFQKRAEQVINVHRC